MKKFWLFFVIVIGCIGVSSAAENDLNFLIGDWIGGGSGQPGQGAGSFSFKQDLQNHIIVRRAHSEYPPTKDKPAIIHDDLLIIYANQSKAIYFDNEGHVIHYDLTTDPKTKNATFLSTDPAPLPLFKLTYTQSSADQITITFEISPTGKTQDLKTYLTGTAKKAAS
jgi:hypothetical protein